MSRKPTYPPASRPVAMGVNGMVSSAHPLASSTGARILAEGGNAFDAAVATAATLSVVEPHMSGVGGIGVALAYVASEERVRALDFSGRTPGAAHPSVYTDENKETGILAPLVPGNVAGWLTLHERYGSLDREVLFRPAVEYAENGFPVTALTSFVITESAPRLRLFPSSASLLLGGADEVPSPGSRLRMPQLAGSLRSIAGGSMKAFYDGELARRIVSGCRALGGLFTEEDLAEYRAEWLEPVNIFYRGYRVYTTPPNSSGFQVLQTLKLMEGFDSSEISYRQPDSAHLLIEAIKLCVEDRIRYAGDPDYVDVPLSKLLSNEHAASQRRRIDRQRAGMLSGLRYSRTPVKNPLVPTAPWESVPGETTHFCVADRDGNVVSVTQTLGAFFGSAVAAGDTGIFLNNGAYWFDLDEGSRNSIGPRKRVDFVLAPTQTFLDGKFFLSVGTTGGYGILQTTPQILMNTLDLGMDVQQAIDSPRFSCSGGVTVLVEEGFPLHVRQALIGWGHEVLKAGHPMGLGAAHGIVVDSGNGVFLGGADPRRDGVALGW